MQMLFGEKEKKEKKTSRSRENVDIKKGKWGSNN